MILYISLTAVFILAVAISIIWHGKINWMKMVEMIQNQEDFFAEREQMHGRYISKAETEAFLQKWNPVYIRILKHSRYHWQKKNKELFEKFKSTFLQISTFIAEEN